MGVFDRFRAIGGRDMVTGALTTQTQETPAVVSTTNVDPEKSLGTVVPENQNDWVKVPEEALPAQDAQQGIQKIEAVTLTWTKTTLALLLIKYVHCLFLV